MIKKYCAFGIGYKDSRGIIVDEGEKYYVIQYQDGKTLTAEFKSLVEVFETEEERDEWIKNQGYQYDPR